MSVDQCSNKFTEWNDEHYSWKRDMYDTHYHNRREAFRAGWFAALKSAERRKTVRAKRPVQQRKAKILRSCESCYGDHDFEYCGKARCYSFSRWKRKTSAVA